MTGMWLRAALWLGLALAATLLSIRLRIATALSGIVVGHRGRSAIRDWVFGSISRRVMAHASCSVLVVRSR